MRTLAAMGRFKSIQTLPNGDVQYKAVFSPAVWDLLNRAGKLRIERYGMKGVTTQDIGIRMLMDTLSAAIQSGDAFTYLLREDDWVQASAAVTKAKVRHELPEGFDRSWLHTDPKRKSGYYGVFTEGAGFSARVRPDNGLGTQKLGYFKSAELAAHARFQYYLRHPTLAYGEAELEVEYMRKMDPTTANLSDVEIWPHVMDHLRTIDRMQFVFGRGCVSLVPGPREPQLAKRAAPPDEPPTQAEIHADLGARTEEPKSVFGDRAKSSTVAIGFEDGDLPECFNDDWKPDSEGDPAKPIPTGTHKLATGESFTIGDPVSISKIDFERVDIEPKPKRGRPRKPCLRCGLRLKALGGDGPDRYHVDEQGRRIVCIAGGISFVARP